MSEYIEEGINGQWTDWKFEAENYKKIYEHLYQENKQLKERITYLENSNNRREETIINLRHEQQLDLYKEVIEEVRGIIESGLDFDNPQYADECEKELLQILDKVKDGDVK